MHEIFTLTCKARCIISIDDKPGGKKKKRQKRKKERNSLSVILYRYSREFRVLQRSHRRCECRVFLLRGDAAK